MNKIPSDRLHLIFYTEQAIQVSFPFFTGYSWGMYKAESRLVCKENCGSLMLF